MAERTQHHRYLIERAIELISREGFGELMDPLDHEALLAYASAPQDWHRHQAALELALHCAYRLGHRDAQRLGTPSLPGPAPARRLPPGRG